MVKAKQLPRIYALEPAMINKSSRSLERNEAHGTFETKLTSPFINPAPPHQTVRAVLPHTAFRSSSLQDVRSRRVNVLNGANPSTVREASRQASSTAFSSEPVEETG